MRSEAELAQQTARIIDMPLHRHLGLRLVRRAAGEAELAFTAGPQVQMHTGAVHGGVLSLLLEPPALIALLPLLPAGRWAVTVDFHIQVLRAVAAGDDVALAARVQRAGRSVAFCRAEARAGGRLCAAADIVKAIVDQPAQGDRP